MQDVGELLSKINVINSKYCEVKALSSPHPLNTQGQPSHFNESFTIIRFMRSTKHLPWWAMHCNTSPSCPSG